MTTKDSIETRIKELLAAIRQGASVTVYGTDYTFQTDAGANVYTELEHTEYPDTLPQLSFFRGELISGEDVIEDVMSGEIGHSYAVKINGAITDTKDGAEGDRLRTDIVKTLQSDPTLSGLCQHLTTITSSSAVGQGEEVISIVEVTLTYQYTTALGGE